MGILGILISLFLLMYLAYRGINVLVLAPLLSLVAVLFHPDVPIMASYTQVFMPALGNYLLKYFPLFLLGSIFGKFMADSGYADKIGHSVATQLGPKHAIFSIVMACALLTYGGVSLFVVAFGIYPIAVKVFKEADIPRRLIPGSIALGSFTFTMTALPGTPAIQNAIPMPYFGTTTFAAPGLGIIASVILLAGGWYWLERRSASAKLRGEGFGNDTVVVTIQSHAEIPMWKALLPLAIVLGLNYVMTNMILPNIDASYLSQDMYGKTSLSKVLGTWALIIALTVGIASLWLLSRSKLKNPIETLNSGTMGSLLPIFNTASEVGYGATIAALPSFAIIKNAVLSISPNQPLVSEAIAVNILAGITGSASGGMSIALESLGKTYLDMAQTANIHPDLLHRVAALSSGGLDTLPHNGAVITLLGICALDHKRSYLDIFVVAVAVPVLATVAVVTLGSLFGSF